jgi:gamma-D-glutamyl-L-lysine dipeptidyl-peptidase
MLNLMAQTLKKALKKSSLPVLFSACLLLGHSSPGWTSAAPAEIAQLNQTLAPQWEQYLKQTLHREKFGLEISAKSVGANDYALEIPKHILRDTVFDLHLHYANGVPQLKGRVYSEAEEKLLTASALKAFGPSLQLQIEHFPYSNIAPDYAITTQTASDLYVKPIAVAGENLATQVRMGTPLEILEYSSDKKFALVRIVDDGYIAWIQRNQMRETELGTYNTWKNNRQVLLMRNLTKPRQLYFGTRLGLVKKSGGQVMATLPDGNQITLSAADIALTQGPPQTPDIAAIIQTSQEYLPKSTQGGGAYLWGGTYGKTLDCSGFVQTIFRVHHVYLPRDADQQMGFTQRVGNTLKQLNELKPGDLVFFSGNRKYPTHVGMYIGQNKFIHSSPKGPYSGIKISTLQGGGEYDRFLQGIYFGGGRVTRSL